MEIVAAIALLAKIGSILLDELAERNEDKRAEIELAKNLLNQFGQRLPMYVEYLSKYSDRGLTIDDLQKMTLQEIDAEADAYYDDGPSD